MRKSPATRSLALLLILSVALPIPAWSQAVDPQPDAAPEPETVPATEPASPPEALTPARPAGHDEDDGGYVLPRRNYIFEREARALASVLDVAPWTAARLLTEDAELRDRARTAVAAYQRRQQVGSGLLIGGLVLTGVGAFLTGIFGRIASSERDHGDSVDREIWDGLGTGIAFLAVGVILDAVGLGKKLGRTPEEDAMKQWFRQRGGTPSAW